MAKKKAASGPYQLPEDTESHELEGNLGSTRQAKPMNYEIHFTNSNSHRGDVVNDGLVESWPYYNEGEKVSARQ